VIHGDDSLHAKELSLTATLLHFDDYLVRSGGDAGVRRLVPNAPAQRVLWVVVSESFAEFELIGTFLLLAVGKDRMGVATGLDERRGDAFVLHVVVKFTVVPVAPLQAHRQKPGEVVLVRARHCEVKVSFSPFFVWYGIRDVRYMQKGGGTHTPVPNTKRGKNPHSTTKERTHMMMMITAQLSYDHEDCCEDQMYVYDAPNKLVCDDVPFCAGRAMIIANAFSSVYASHKDVLYICSNQGGKNLTVPQAMELAVAKCTGTHWYSTGASCESFVATVYDVAEIANNRRLTRAEFPEFQGKSIEELVSNFEDDDGNDLFPNYPEGSLLNMLFKFDSRIQLGLSRDIRVGDVVTISSMCFDEFDEPIDKMGRDAAFRMFEETTFDERYTRIRVVSCER